MTTYKNVTAKATAELIVWCPEGHSHYVVDLNELWVSSSECELCGDHTDVEYSWKCDECNKGYIYTLKST